MALHPQYCTVEELAAWLQDADADPTQLALAIESASRAVDRSANRQFGQLDSAETRLYTAEYHRTQCQWVVDIDDLMTTTDLVVEVDNDRDGTHEAAITAYVLTPPNANASGRPWTRIEVLPSSATKPNGIRLGVTVTARWGWTAVPNSIKLAAMLQAGRFLARRENPSGVLTSKQVDDVAYGWRVSDLDSDLELSIAPYRKRWAAA